MTEECSIRPFRQDDLARLLAIREAAFRPVFSSFRTIVGETIASAAFASAEREQGDHLDALCRAETGREVEVHVVERSGELAAFVAIALDRETRVGEIELNAVHPDHQGAGIGAAMYGLALDRMRAAGMTVATVGTGGDDSHAPARRAYEKAGFGRAIPSLYLYRAL
ncbi:MAG: GNAT family N-acetyltransferase [Parvularculaceae bacterium]